MAFHVSKYIQQPAWRVWLLHYVAKALGVLAHVEGMPIGSNRLPAWRPSGDLGEWTECRSVPNAAYTLDGRLWAFNNGAALGPETQIKS